MIYLLEDDSAIRELVVYTLCSTGLEATGFAAPSEFYDAMERALPELLILDIMLPEEDGLSILRRLRASPRTEHLPVMMLTARSSEYDKVIGLDGGADDYLTKPFGMMELISRVRALLRRAEFGRERRETLRCGDIECDTTTHTMRACGEELTLTLKEYELLHLMLEHPMQVFTRDRLLSSIWGYEFDGESRTVDVHIRSLRLKLGLRRDMIFPGREAPEADKGIDCRVKGSARARGAIQRLLQEVCGLRLQLRRAVPVQACDIAVLCRGGKQGFERTERVLRLRDKGFLAPDAQAHQRVHGKKLCLMRLRLLWAAARQDQCCQKYGSEPFFQGDHLIFRDHYIKKEKFSQIVFDIFLPGWYDKQAASKRYKLEVCPHASRARLQKGRCKQTCRQLSLPVASSTASRRAT